jgi:DoxX-like family
MKATFLNVVLWMLQLLLAAAFLAHGWLMLAPPADMLVLLNEQIGQNLRIFIGVAEVLAAVGLIAPGMTGMLPWLTPLAAVGLMLVTGCAFVLHVSRGEISSAMTVAILFTLAALVAYLRWRVRPLAARPWRRRALPA